MNRLSASLTLGALALAALAGCTRPADEHGDADEHAAPATPTATVGGYDGFGVAPADTAGAVAAATVAAHADDYAGKPVVVAGTVSQVCQMAGCWATLQTASGTIRIKMPKENGQYTFTLPKDISGRRVIAAGTLARTALSADHAEHMAKESGTPGADTTAYADTEELQLTATGVLVAKS